MKFLEFFEQMFDADWSGVAVQAVLTTRAKVSTDRIRRTLSDGSPLTVYVSGATLHIIFCGEHCIQITNTEPSVCGYWTERDGGLRIMKYGFQWIYTPEKCDEFIFGMDDISVLYPLGEDKHFQISLLEEIPNYEICNKAHEVFSSLPKNVAIYSSHNAAEYPSTLNFTELFETVKDIINEQFAIDVGSMSRRADSIF